MKNKFTILLLLMSFAVSAHLRAQSARKAVINSDYAAHQAGNYYNFSDRAPAGWSCYVAGGGGGGIPGLDWNPVAGGPMVQHAADEGFDIVLHYGGGALAPDTVYSAAQNGCAVFTFHSAVNAHYYGDYRILPGFFGRGPCPAMIVSGGFSDSTAAVYAYGPQGEFIDAVYDDTDPHGGDPAQSWAHSAAAARYAKLKDHYVALGQTWNVFDLRQALRQTCSFYAAGWREDGAYGFPKVLNRVGNNFTEATFPASLDDLDAGPPMLPYAQVAANGNSITFHWYNFQQTRFLSTVIKVNGTTIYDGTDSTYVWTPTITGTAMAEFFTKVTSGSTTKLSRSAQYEPYIQVPLSGLSTNIESCAAVCCPILSASQFSFTVSAGDNSQWDVYQSSDLANWQLIGGVTLNGQPASFTDTQVSGVAHRFYRVSNGSCCSQAIGFTRVTAVPGYTLIANQLDAADNTLNGLFGPTMANGSSLPDGTILYTGNGSPFVGHTWSASTQSFSPNGTATLAPGQSSFIHNPGSQAFEVAFAGLVREGHLVNPISAGNNYVSSILPQTGTISTDLGYSPTDGDLVWQWNETSQEYDQGITYYDGYGWYDGGFSPVEPSLVVGKGVVLSAQSANSWVRDFSACSGQIVCTPPVVSVDTQKGQDYDPAYTYYDGYGWFNGNFDPIEPEAAVGGGFILSAQATTSWVRDFTACPGQTLCSSLALAVNSLAAGSFSFNIAGAGGSTMNVDASTDLVNWQSVGSVSLAAGAGTFTDTQITGVAYRFYRVNNSTCCSQAIGFTRQTLGLGYSVIADQLDAPANTLNALFGPTMVDGSSLPDGTIIYTGINAQSVSHTWNASTHTWSPNGTATLAPGEAAFIHNPTTHPVAIAFAGLVREGHLVKTISAGNNLVSSMVPQAGGISSVLGYNPNDNDLVTFWNPTIHYDNPPLSATMFSFKIAGPAGSRWTVYSSSDLTTWQSIGETTLNSGSTTFTDSQVNGVADRFYRLSDGNCCSRTIGFTRVSAVPGYTLIANQFDAADNSLNGLFGPTMANGSSLPDGTILYTGNGSPFVSHTWNVSGHAWSPDGDATLAPGQSSFIHNPGSQAFEVAFAGLVREGHLVNPISAGNNYVSSILPQTGTISTDLGYSPTDGDLVWQWNETSQEYDQGITYYDGYGWYDGGFSPVEPSLVVGKGVVLSAQNANSWVRDFSVPCP